MYRVECLEELHDSKDARYENILEQTIQLLNTEWPMSKRARNNMLNSRNRLELTYHLVMLDGENVIAHASACDTSFEQRLFASKAPLVERVFAIWSVLVEPSMRSKGLGQILMKELESRIVKDHEGLSEQSHLKSIKFTLRAKSKRASQFYSKLGYEPVTSCMSNGAKETSPQVANKSIHETTPPSSLVQVNCPPPPPPLPPPLASINPVNSPEAKDIPMFKRVYL